MHANTSQNMYSENIYRLVKTTQKYCSCRHLEKNVSSTRHHKEFEKAESLTVVAASLGRACCIVRCCVGHRKAVLVLREVVPKLVVSWSDHVRDFRRNGLNFVHEHIPVRHETICVRFVPRMHQNVNLVGLYQGDQVRHRCVTFLRCVNKEKIVYVRYVTRMKQNLLQLQ